MRTYLPLNAMRAFESAARHLSFARAAEELCVTPTAISHHVRSLEEFLEVELFERKNGRLTLTAAAAASLEELSQGFDILAAAIAPLNRRSGGQKIAVAASPSVASLWLMPKLQRFFAVAPGIEVSICTTMSPAEFDEAGYDVSICSTEAHPNRRVDHLMDEKVLPVCAPALLAGASPDPRDALATLPLIHDDKTIDRFPTWRRYFEEMRVPLAHPIGGLRFNQSSLAIEAAMNGHGVLLGRSRLIASALADQRLVVLYDAYPLACPYYTVRKPGSVARPVKIFLDWLAQEVRDEDATLRTEVATAHLTHESMGIGGRPAERHRLAALDGCREEQMVG